MTEAMKDKLSRMNGLEKKRYEDKVRGAVRNEMFPEDEIAILRKAVALLFEVVATLHPGEINNAEFKAYNELIEKIKSEERESLK